MPVPERLLVLRMSGVGDVLWTTPLLKALRRGFPQARIHYVVRESCAPVLENNPDVDELLVLPKGGLISQLAFLSRIRNKRCNLCLDLVGTPRTAIQSLASGAGMRIGFDFGYRKFFYNRVLSAREANYGHEVEFNLYALKTLGLMEAGRELVYNLTREEREYRSRAWQELGYNQRDTVVGLLPTGGWACKRWPVDNFSELGRLERRHSRRKFLVFWGSRSEQEDADRIARGIGPHAALAPQTTLRQMAALLSGCAAVVGNDTGPLHIATALDVPVVSFYGPTSPRSQGPWGKGHRVLRDDSLSCLECNRTDCRQPKCMTGIKVSSAAQALEEVLTERKQS
jgi:lipopolysaccharide heptosyltransferase II